MVELVLVSPFLFLLVGGIIQFSLALNYWLDMQRLANQGARWAVVARYPLDPPNNCTNVNAPCAPALTDTLALQAQSDGLDPAVSICFPNGSYAVGDPVRIRLETNFSFVPILGIGTVTLGADAQMRIEQPRGSVYDATGPC
jgi:Flp pilus assembly protein TadG